MDAIFATFIKRIMEGDEAAFNLRREKYGF